MPRTWLRVGLDGMIQLWQETDPEQNALGPVPEEDVPANGWKEVLKGQDVKGRIVSSPWRTGTGTGWTTGSPFTVITSCAPWCGGGWIGDELSDEELEGVDRVLEALQGELGSQLAKLLTAEEVASLASRCAQLRLAGTFSEPSGNMPAVPWPLF